MNISIKKSMTIDFGMYLFFSKKVEELVQYSLRKTKGNLNVEWHNLGLILIIRIHLLMKLKIH